jgi:hypothetical protein
MNIRKKVKGQVCIDNTLRRWCEHYDKGITKDKVNSFSLIKSSLEKKKEEEKGPTPKLY